MWRLALVPILASCGVPDGEYFGTTATADPHVFRWCNQDEPDYLDPALSSSTVSAPIVSAIFDALTTYGADGNPIPSLATRWEISDDLRTFTFHLRADAKWSNGRAVTAYDVAYTAIRVSEAMTGSPNGDNLAPVRGIMSNLARRRFVLRREVAPLHAGDVVELATGDPTDPPPDDPNRRTASRELALRDLGADEAAAYAHVAAGAEVTIVMRSGGRATLPTPGAASREPWAYVHYTHGDDEQLGWVPIHELDGEPAADVEFRVRAADSDPAAPAPVVVAHGRDLLRDPDVLGIAVPDPWTIRFETTDPTPFFLSVTDNRALRTTPIEAVSRSPRHWTDPDRIVDNGPLHLVAHRERDAIELVRSPTYWDPTSVKTDRYRILAINDQAAASNLYYAGQCDATASNMVPSTYLPVLNGTQRGFAYPDYHVDPYLGVYFAWINTKRLSNRHLRRALSLAIDRTQIPRFTHGGEFPSAQLTPGTPISKLSPANLAACGVTRDTPGVALIMEDAALCYVPPPGLDYDLAAAKREIAAARVELGADFPTTIEYRYNAGSEAHKQIAEYLQAAWSAIGVDVTITSQDFNALLADTRSGDYDIARLGNIGNVADTESEFLPLFRCGAPDNRGQYCSPEYERLLTKARPLRDRNARNAVLREAEAVMIEDAPVIPLYVYTQKHLIKPYVRDYAINVIDQPSLWRAWIATPAP